MKTSARVTVGVVAVLGLATGCAAKDVPQGTITTITGPARNGAYTLHVRYTDRTDEVVVFRVPARCVVGASYPRCANESTVTS